MPSKKDKNNPTDALNAAADAPPPLDPFAQLGLPSMLNDAMGKAGELPYEDNLGDGEDVGLTYAAFPQKEGKYLAEKKYWIWLGRKGDDGQNEDLYVKSVDILHVDSLVRRGVNGRIISGAQIMWPHDQNGTRLLEGDPACQSLNGVYPFAQHIGKEIYDFRTGKTNKIGFKPDPINGQLMPQSNLDICGTCPFQAWLEVGGKNIQMCQPNFAWVVYDITGDRLVKVSGQNKGVQLALQGRKAKSYGAKQDGGPLSGIETIFRETGKRRIFFDVIDGDVILSRLQWQYVIGLTTSEDGETITPIRVLNEDGTVNDDAVTRVREALKSGNFFKVVADIPIYQFAPEGRPEVLGSYDVPVHPVVMRCVKNNFLLNGDPNRPNPSSVPEFFVDRTRLVTPDQYAAYLESRGEYRDSGMRDIMMAFDAIDRVREALVGASPIHVSNPLAQHQQIAPTVGDEVTEGDYVVGDDVPTDE